LDSAEQGREMDIISKVAAMNLKEAIERRKSVRKYTDEPVPEELVEEILSYAVKAPSAGALRPYKVIVTEKQLTRYKAPLNIVVCALPEKSAAKYGKRGRDLYAIQDATLVGAYIQLLAVDAGLSTVWVGAFNEGRIKRMLGLEEGCRPIAILPIGYKA
jgi:nitroreductase